MGMFGSSPPRPRSGDDLLPRLSVRGKFLFDGEDKFYARGVTYGTFRPRDEGCEFPLPEVVEADFAAMAAHGINAVRTYIVPPRWVLDSAAAHGLRVMVGLPWEQHVTFLDDRARARAIEDRVRDMVRTCAGHPAILCYTVGNEIPASIVRWHGRRRGRAVPGAALRGGEGGGPGWPRHLRQLPDHRVPASCRSSTWSRSTSTSRTGSRWRPTSRGCRTSPATRPLVMAEIGLDSRRHGLDEQARVLRWQVETAADAGCAGAFVFAWTDEWHRGGHDIEDWDFGLTTRDRRPKPALASVRAAFARMPPVPGADWPRISVVVCTYNGAATLRDCLDGLLKLDYPDYEVIVVDDGSTDGTAAIAAAYPYRVISTENRGLSAARNTGLAAATGEIVAYIDDDARPDPHWLTLLALTFRTTDHAGVGGPNLPPAGDGAIADCVANAPGGPIHVLLSDREAEHIPGCNMAFRRECLEAIGGFDPQFRTAGDDVDLCWRLQERGWTLGFNPAAIVWHHRRNSLRMYWRQQRGYGRAEALLERKWPEQYNAPGHLAWSGRLYGRGVNLPPPRRWRVYYGTWGSSPFQQLYRPADGTLASLPLMPEWYLGIAALAAVSLLGVTWPPLFLALPVLAACLAPLLTLAVRGAARARFPTAPRSRWETLRLRALVAGLYLAQPVARLDGRVRHGLTPWRARGGRSPTLPRRRSLEVWSEHGEPPDTWVRRVEDALRSAGAAFHRGGDFDRWDLHVGGGLLGAARLRIAVEEHGGGRQLTRYLAWPRCSGTAVVLCVALAGLAAVTAVGGAVVATGVLAVLFTAVALRLAVECGRATAVAVAAVRVPAPAPEGTGGDAGDAAPGGVGR